MKHTPRINILAVLKYKTIKDVKKTSKILILGVCFFPLRYVPDQYKTQQKCDKAIPEYGGTLKPFPNFYKNKKMYNEQLIIIL